MGEGLEDTSTARTGFLCMQPSTRVNPPKSAHLANQRGQTVLPMGG